MLVVYSTVLYGTVLYFMVLYYTVQYNIFTKTVRTTSKSPLTNRKKGGGLEPILSSLQKVKMYVKRYKVAKGAKSAKVTRVKR